jgi:hypothetical protein
MLAGVLTISCATMRADFTYEESSKMTGGTLYNVLRAGGPFTKRAREAQISTVSIQGNRMARYDKDSINIVDLDKETITDINLEKKQYSVTTFADMRRAMEKALAQAQKEQKKGNGDASAEMKFKVSAKATGKTETINGVSAKEMVVNMEMVVQDKKSGESGAMNVVSDGWFGTVPGYQEVKAFELKMAEKLAGTFHPSQAAMAMAQPEMVRGMAEAAKEMAKVDGVPVRTIVKQGMGPVEELMKSGSGAEKEEKPKPTAKETAGAIAGGLTGFGGFGRKKEEKPKEEAKAQEGPQAVLMMEMTTEISKFSSTADASKFAVPANFKQVESELTKMANKK